MGLKHNMREARSEVARIRERVVRATEVGGDAAAALWFAETQLRVPKETTALMNSGELDTDHRGSRFSWVVTYGNSQVQGVGVYYAAAVHERVGAFHAPPTGAKYVEFPLLQAKESFKSLITQAVRKAV